MDDVEGGDVVELFSRQKEESVEELGELAEEVPPRGRRHSVTWEFFKVIFHSVFDIFQKYIRFDKSLKYLF